MEDPFDIIRNIIRKGMIDAMTRSILVYYHYYKSDKDSLVQIYSSLLDLFIPTDENAKILYKEVINNLENKYFYEISNYAPLKLKNNI